MSRDETLHGSDFTEKSNLVNLCHHSIQDLSFEGSEYNGFVLQISEYIELFFTSIYTKKV